MGVSVSLGGTAVRVVVGPGVSVALGMVVEVGRSVSVAEGTGVAVSVGGGAAVGVIGLVGVADKVAVGEIAAVATTPSVAVGVRVRAVVLVGDAAAKAEASFTRAFSAMLSAVRACTPPPLYVNSITNRAKTKTTFQRSFE